MLYLPLVVYFTYAIQIYELKIERDGLKEEVNSLYNELDHLKKQVGVMQNNMVCSSIIVYGTK